MTDWMENYGSHCRMALFYENHDNPRMISKVNPNPIYRGVLAKLLAAMQLTLKGTPFIFQGQELGMVNREFTSIAELHDVESLNLYEELIKTMSEEAAFKRILAGTRDHARVPMQWTDGVNAGFSEGAPWIDGGDDCSVCNAAAQLEDKDSVLSFYRALIALRREHEALVYGDIKIVNKNEKNLFTYWRSNENVTFFIECNLGSRMRERKDRLKNAVCVLSNYGDAPSLQLRPYEAVIWRIDGSR